MFSNNVIIFGSIISVILFIYLINWYIKETVKYEIKQTYTHYNKKRKLKKQKQMEETNVQNNNMETFGQHEMDSYVDPADKNEEDNEREEENEEGFVNYSHSRLNKNNIGMRDIVDNTR